MEDPYTYIEPDIWVKVFQNLPLADRFRVRKVCKTFVEHFLTLSKRININKTLSTINFNPLSINVKSRNNDHTSMHFNGEGVSAILNVYGSNVKKIIFDRQIPPLNNLTQRLNRLKELVCYNVVARDLLNLCENENSFQAIEIKSNDEVNSLFELTLQYLIGINYNRLSSLTIFYSILTGSCISNVNFELITNLKLYTKISNKANLHKLIRSSTNLEKFTCVDIDFDSLLIISLNCTKLSELKLCVFDSPFTFYDPVDHTLNTIFRKNQNLNTVKLKNFQYLTGFGNRYLNFNNIKSIHISSPGISFLAEDFNNKLELFKNLIHLKLCNINVDNFAVMSTGIMNCLDLKFLKISYCKDVTDDVLIKACKTLNSLQSLHLNTLHNITDRVFESLIISCPKLNDLKIDNCINITDETIIIFSQNKRDLKSLTLTNLHAINGEFIQNLTELKYLNLQNSTAVIPHRINELINKNINLECINIRECIQFDTTFLDSSIEFLNERQNDFNLVLKIRNTNINLNNLSTRCKNLYIKP